MAKNILAAIGAVALLAAATPAMAETVEFQIINNSSIDLHYFYTTPSNEDSWGEDLLENLGVLEAGFEATATIGDGSDQCLYDFKFVGAEEEELIVNEVDICSLASYTLQD
ncbi:MULTISPECIES: hypothetical protein [unclassified Devosia]|uniref:hypothetical protein n=1 Tax=unclassified Devosia TaxID=196773 RepID=UPI00145D0AC6|nr:MULTISPECIES: hypothetical protein [unclassified Devosia]MBJ7577224.1 hypothetical protein [Devosia sp. MC532]MBK1795034.1 hypothetical protein [Devosia sp. WQ 349K1]